MGLRRTRIKICGISQVDDALAAAFAGADAIGLVFHASSPRVVNVEQAAEICAALPPFVTAVGLFVNASVEAVNNVLHRVPLTALQFHGDETPEYCRQFARPYLKALRMRDELDVLAAAQEFNEASGLLLDTYRAGVAGGTGEIFDWQRVPHELASRIVLAGGLNADNVGAAIAQVRPYAVDVSGGVESAPGVKDVHRIQSFVAAVRRADQLEHSSD
ncbi:MAG: phosphoribosylanthranilate isomerase [Verrucomicrobiaceae bacterium]|nr:phosphoribosylanthranilate isomerase [Verrucomicrobiaceae bacterium]